MAGCSVWRSREAPRAASHPTEQAVSATGGGNDSSSRGCHLRCVQPRCWQPDGAPGGENRSTPPPYTGDGGCQRPAKSRPRPSPASSRLRRGGGPPTNRIAWRVMVPPRRHSPTPAMPTGWPAPACHLVERTALSFYFSKMKLNRTTVVK